MDGTAGQAAIGLLAGLLLLILVTAALAGAILTAAPVAWEATIGERVRARREILGTPAEMAPRWPTARIGAEGARGK